MCPEHTYTGQFNVDPRELLKIPESVMTICCTAFRMDYVEHELYMLFAQLKLIYRPFRTIGNFYSHIFTLK